MTLVCNACYDSFELQKVPTSKLAFCPYCGAKVVIAEAVVPPISPEGAAPEGPAPQKRPGWSAEVDDGWFKGEAAGPATVKMTPDAVPMTKTEAAAKAAVEPQAPKPTTAATPAVAKAPEAKATESSKHASGRGSKGSKRAAPEAPKKQAPKPAPAAPEALKPGPSPLIAGVPVAPSPIGSAVATPTAVTMSPVVVLSGSKPEAPKGSAKGPAPNPGSISALVPSASAAREEEIAGAYPMAKTPIQTLASGGAAARTSAPAARPTSAGIAEPELSHTDEEAATLRETPSPIRAIAAEPATLRETPSPIRTIAAEPATLREIPRPIRATEAEPVTIREIPKPSRPEEPTLSSIIISPEALEPMRPEAPSPGQTGNFASGTLPVSAPPESPVTVAPAPQAERRRATASASEAESEDRFFASDVSAPRTIEDLADEDDARLAQRGGNRIFAVVAALVGVGVAAFVIYVATREKTGTSVIKKLAGGVSAQPASGPQPPSNLTTPAAPEAPEEDLPPSTDDPPPDSSEAAAAPDEVPEPPALDLEPPREEGAAPKKRVVRAPRPEIPQPEVTAPPPPPSPPPAPVDSTLVQAQARYRVGSALLVQGNFAGAVVEFRQALKLSGKISEAHRGLGVAYAALQRKSEAIRHYEAYLRARPNAPDRDTIREALQGLKN
jgi:hypothetical protein